MLANLLKRILPRIISANQSAFMEGRQITDFVVVAHQSLHLKFISGDPDIVCKLDFQKSYDRVDWCFLHFICREWDLEIGGRDEFICFFHSSINIGEW